MYVVLNPKFFRDLFPSQLGEKALELDPIHLGSVATALLGEMGYDGDLVVHTEYEFDEPIIVGFADKTPPRLEPTAREDAEYLRRILADKPALQWRGRDDE